MIVKALKFIVYIHYYIQKLKSHLYVTMFAAVYLSDNPTSHSSTL